MRAIDKLDRLGRGRACGRCSGPGGADESGDFTAGRRARRRAGGGRSSASWRRGAATGAATCARLRELVGGSRVGLEGVQELEAIAELLEARGAAGGDRPLGRARPRLLHRAGLRGGADLRDRRRRRPAAAVRLGRRRRALRRPRARFTGEAVPATGVSIGVDRLLAALGEKGRLAARRAGAGRRHGDGPRPDGRLPGDGGRAARRRAPRRGVPRRRQHGAAAQVRRPARQRRSR